MRQSRNAVIKSLSSGFAIPTYTGSHAVFGDEKQGYIELYSSGTLTFPKKGTVDVFVLGGGNKGGDGYPHFNSQGYLDAVYGGNGGDGAIGVNLFAHKVSPGNYSIVIGSGNGNSSAFDIISNTKAGNGGLQGFNEAQGSGLGSRSGANGGDGTSYPFGETSGIFYKQYGAGGGGGNGSGYKTGRGTGGTLGGGEGAWEYYSIKAKAGTANTGSGGGGGGGTIKELKEYNYGGAGGSGIVIVRWGYSA